MLASPTEDSLWRSHIAGLRAAVEMRKPDALSKIRLGIAKLESEISALSLRRELRAQAGLDSPGLDTRLTFLADRMNDLRGVAVSFRATPLDHDYNCTPEVAVRSREIITGDGELTGEYKSSDPGIDDLSDELKRAADDIKSGWMVITKGAACAVSGRSPGGLPTGEKAEKLAEQYYHWVSDLHRKRIGTWSFDDVVCNGMSRTECAMKRRCLVVKVYDELVIGLTLYANRFPPIGDMA